jgi:peptide-methionine (S)-S-oxide reductase
MIVFPGFSIPGCAPSSPALEHDPGEITYDERLVASFGMHAPTVLDRQGPDAGSQYRSVFFCHTAEQGAETMRQRLEADGRFRRPIVKAIEPAAEGWPAEDQRQKYCGMHRRADFRT